jgi:hypothetical protein
MGAAYRCALFLCGLEFSTAQIEPAYIERYSQVSDQVRRSPLFLPLDLVGKPHPGRSTPCALFLRRAQRAPESKSRAKTTTNSHELTTTCATRDWIKIKNMAHPAIERAMVIALSRRQRSG